MGYLGVQISSKLLPLFDSFFLWKVHKKTKYKVAFIEVPNLVLYDEKLTGTNKPGYILRLIHKFGFSNWENSVHIVRIECLDYFCPTEVRISFVSVWYDS